MREQTAGKNRSSTNLKMERTDLKLSSCILHSVGWQQRPFHRATV